MGFVIWQSQATILLYVFPSFEQAGHVRYINILAWLRGLRDRELLYLVSFSFYSSLFWELRYKRNFKKFAILTRKPRSHVTILIYRAWPIASLDCSCPLRLPGVISLRTTDRKLLNLEERSRPKIEVQLPLRTILHTFSCSFSGLVRDH